MVQRSWLRFWMLFALVAVALLLLWRLLFGNGGLREQTLLRQQITELKAENAKLAERNALMQADVEDLKHGNGQVEETARKDLGMIRKDETFYQILDKSQAANAVMPQGSAPGAAAPPPVSKP